MNQTIKTAFLVLVYNILTVHVTLFIDRSNIRFTVERIIVPLTQRKDVQVMFTDYTLYRLINLLEFIFETVQQV